MRIYTEHIGEQFYLRTKINKGRAYTLVAIYAFGVKLRSAEGEEIVVKKTDVWPVNKVWKDQVTK